MPITRNGTMVVLLFRCACVIVCVIACVIACVIVCVIVCVSDAQTCSQPQSVFTTTREIANTKVASRKHHLHLLFGRQSNCALCSHCALCAPPLLRVVAQDFAQTCLLQRVVEHLRDQCRHIGCVVVQRGRRRVAQLFTKGFR